MGCPTRRFSLTIAPLLLALACNGNAMAQTLTRSMVESHVKEWVAAGNSNDPETAARLDPPANGFGYRQLKSRSAEIPASTQLENLMRKAAEALAGSKARP